MQPQPSTLSTVASSEDERAHLALKSAYKLPWKDERLVVKGVTGMRCDVPPLTGAAANRNALSKGVKLWACIAMAVLASTGASAESFAFRDPSNSFANDYDVTVTESILTISMRPRGESRTSYDFSCALGPHLSAEVDQKPSRDVQGTRVVLRWTAPSCSYRAISRRSGSPQIINEDHTYVNVWLSTADEARRLALLVNRTSAAALSRPQAQVPSVHSKPEPGVRFDGPRELVFPSAEQRLAEERRKADQAKADAALRAEEARSQQYLSSLRDEQANAKAAAQQFEQMQLRRQRAVEDSLVQLARHARPASPPPVPPSIKRAVDMEVDNSTPAPTLGLFGHLMEDAGRQWNRGMEEFRSARARCDADSFTRIVCNKLFLALPPLAGAFVSGSRDVDEVNRVFDDWGE